MTADVWMSEPQHTVLELMQTRLDSDPDGPYLDVCGTELTAAGVHRVASSLANTLVELGVGRGDRVATLIENSPEATLAWWGILTAGAVAVPVNTAYKGSYLAHQLGDSGSKAMVVEASLVDRLARVVPDLPDLVHVIVIGDDRRRRPRRHPATRGPTRSARIRPRRRSTCAVRPGHLHLHRRHDRSLEGLHAQPPLPRRPGQPDRHLLAAHGRRRRVDAACRCSTSTRIATAVVGPLVFGGRAAIYSRFSVSNFWPEMNRVGATITSTLGTMAYLLAHDVDRPEMPRSGARRGQHQPAPAGRGADARRGRERDPRPVRPDHLQRRLRRDRGQPGVVAAARRR